MGIHLAPSATHKDALYDIVWTSFMVADIIRNTRRLILDIDLVYEGKVLVIGNASVLIELTAHYPIERSHS